MVNFLHRGSGDHAISTNESRTSSPVGNYKSPAKVQPDAAAAESETGEVYTTSSSRRQIGTVSAVFLIFNRMVGTGIFATPSSIFSLSGSVGLSLFMWVAGGLIALSGMLVYMEFGTGLPRNGGEKNYLEYVFRKPRFLVTTSYAMYVVLLGWAGSNSVVFGEYILNAANVEVTRWNQRGVGLACITAAFLVHSFSVKWGLRLQNFLGIIKLLILILIIVSGFVSCYIPSWFTKSNEYRLP